MSELLKHWEAFETLLPISAIMHFILHPMVESCLPAGFLKAFYRSNVISTSFYAKERLDNLMEFLKSAVEGDERINLVVAVYGKNPKPSLFKSMSTLWPNSN